MLLGFVAGGAEPLVATTTHGVCSVLGGDGGLIIFITHHKSQLYHIYKPCLATIVPLVILRIVIPLVTPLILIVLPLVTMCEPACVSCMPASALLPILADFHLAPHHHLGHFLIIVGKAACCTMFTRPPPQI